MAAVDKLAGKTVPLTTISQSFTVANAPAAASYPGAIIRVTNGNAGSDCLAFSNGTDWLVMALGSAIAAS